MSTLSKVRVYGMSILEKLHRIEPELYADVARKGPTVASPCERQALADGLRLHAAAMATRELRADGAASLGIVGGREIVVQLLASGTLDAFAAVHFLGERPGPPLPVPGRGLVPCAALDENSASDALLLLDETIHPPFKGPTRLIPRLDAHHIPFRVPDFWCAPYAEHLAAQKRLARETLAELDLSRTILFAGVYTYFNFCKLSLTLRGKGFRTAFLCLNPSNQAFKQGFFDVVLDAGGNLELFYSLLAMVHCKAVHFQGWLGLHCFVAAAAMLSASPLVTEFNDLPQYCFSDEEYDRLFGAGEAALEKRAVRLALTRSVGVALNYRQGSAGVLLDAAPASTPVIHLHSHPLPNLFADMTPASEARRSVVFCGTLNPSHYPAPPFGDVQLLGLIRELTAQGIAFHVFMNPYQRKGERGAFWDYEYFARQEPLFTLHDGVSPERLSEAIGGLGWGSMLHRFPADFAVLSPHMENMLPTKFFSYLEAGLPVLVSSRIAAVAELVREHGLGLVVDQEDFSRLGELLDKADYSILRANVRTYRSKHCLERKVHELVTLYDRLQLSLDGCNTNRNETQITD